MAAEGIISEQNRVLNGVLSSLSPGEALFQRRIEFHPARKPFSSIPTAGGSDFQIETLNPSAEVRGTAAVGSGASAEVVGAGEVAAKAGRRSEGGVTRECAVDPEISFRITFQRIGAGLANLGNTCFLNSVLQCLTYTEPFAAYLQSGKHKSSCHTSGFCAMCALQNHVMTALRSSGKILSPSHLVKNLRSVSRNFRNSRQEDAHEYMVNLLESMHKCCLPSGVPSESPGAYDKSLVHKIFGGRLRSQVKCMQCSFSSNKFDPFLDLSLEIMKADTLQKALSHFTSFEQLDGGEKQYQCQRCKQKVRAIKRLTIDKAPYVLTIHLKRFGSDIPGQKIDKRVEFGPNLDLKPFVSDPQREDLQYTLYGVLVHAGWSTHSGHYYCYVRTSSGLWHSLNDNQVSQVSEKVVLSQKAYMLFYIRNRSTVLKKPTENPKEGNFASKNLHSTSQDVNVSTQKCIDGRGPISLEQNTLVSKPDVHKISENVASSEYSLVRNPSSIQESSHKVSFSHSNGCMVNHFQNSAVKDCTNDPTLAGHSLSGGDISKALSKQAASMADCPKQSDLLKETKAQVTVEKLEHCFVGQKIHGNGFISSNPKNPNNQESNAIPDKGATGLKSDQTGKTKPSVLSIGADECAKELSLSLSNHRVSDMDENHHVANDTAGNRVSKGGNCLTSSLGQPSSVDNIYLEEALVGAEEEHCSRDHNHSNAMTKKCFKKANANTIHLGLKHSLFASFALRKKKNLRRSKMKSSNTRKAIRTDTILDVQQPSTSEQVYVIDAHVKNSKKKTLPSRMRREVGPTENDKMFNVHHSKASAEDLKTTKTKNSVTITTSKLSLANANANPNPSSCYAREGFLVDKDPTRANIMDILMRGLTETAVPKWDDVELPSSSILEPKDSSNGNIGHVLDEWDEEYDRGKRKKVKKSGGFSMSTNPFQVLATQNIQKEMKRKMKISRTNSENQPFRI